MRTETPVHRPATAELLPILALVVIWVAMAVIVNPVGDFPLNDDWSYGRAVKTLLEQGRPEIIDIVTMTLIAQVYWGALFCLPFGFSFTALRISTLTLGLVGVIAVYCFLREIGAGRRIALIGALLLAANPIYFALSNTFMTDVPFIAVVMLSLLAWVRGLRRASTVSLVVGAALACVAVLIRQTGLAIPIALGLAYVIKRGRRPAVLLQAVLPFAVVAGVYLGYQRWLDVTQGIPQFYTDQNRWMLEFLSSGFSNIVSGLDSVAVIGAMYLGWFLFPLLMILFAHRWRESLPQARKRGLILAGGLLLILLAGLVREGRLMPLKGEPTGDILTMMGVGPFTLWDVFVLRLDVLSAIPSTVWVVITITGLAGGVMLMYEVLASLGPLFRRSKGDSSPDKSVSALLLTVMLIALSPVILMRTHGYFDRYFLPLVPPLAIYLVHSARPLRPGRALTAAALLMIALSGMFGVALTHDYLAWNRTRWTALDRLVNEEGVAPSEIDGGLEFNSWHNYDPLHWNAWGLVNNEYMVAFSPVEGYDVVSEYPFGRWLPREQAVIFVLQKVY